MLLQEMFFWVSAGLYALGFTVLLAGHIFNSKKFIGWSTNIFVVGVLANLFGVVQRGLDLGRVPFFDFVEVLTGDAFVLMVIYLYLQRKHKNFSVVGLFMAPVAFLMVGYAMVITVPAQGLPPAYLTIWLYIHVFFAKTSYGAALVAGALGIAFLLKEKNEALGKGGYLVKSLPDSKRIDELVYQFSAYAFILLGIMMLTGAIWAKQSWGRYWGWDPIETWALISWFVYGIYLHLRLTHRWRGKRSAWLAIGAFILIVFSYFFTPFIYHTLHEHIVY